MYFKSVKSKYLISATDIYTFLFYCKNIELYFYEIKKNNRINSTQNNLLIKTTYMKDLLLLMIGLLTFSHLQAQNSDYWYSVDENTIAIPTNAERAIVPESYETFALNLEGLKTYLQNAPMEGTVAAKNKPLIVAIPLPNNESALFEIFESPVMAPELAAKFPMIKTFAGQGLDDPSMKIRFDYSLEGFHAILSTPEGDVYIDPYVKGMQTNYISYYTKNNHINPDVKTMLQKGHAHDGDMHLDWLETDGGDNSPFNNSDDAPETGSAGAVNLYKFQLALASTSEYAQNHGNTKAGVLSAMVYALSRVNFIFEREVSIRLELVPNNDEIIYLDDGTMDPYTNGNAGNLMNENTVNLNTVIGVGNYDVGHVFSTSPCTISLNGQTVNIGGVSGGTGIVCGDNKARGVSCEWGVSDQFYIGTLCHELGHQFGAPHPWSNCNDEWNASQLTPGAAYEPGSGSTIMSYAGACGANNVQFNEDFYFHVNSLQTMMDFSREFGGAVCSEVLPTDNFEPELQTPYGDGLKIPLNTPFQLMAYATDPNPDDTLTYCWEQYNLGPVSPLGNPFGNAPSFRTFEPTLDGYRSFPRIGTVLNNGSDVTEVLPTYARNLTFRCTVRDGKWGGAGTIWEEISFDAVESAGPFLITYPNSFEVFEVGEYVEVTWDVANTDNSQVNCQQVNILFADDGKNYAYTLATNVANNGSYTVVMPNAPTNFGRIKVEAADNIFYDVCDQNIKIVSPTTPGYALSVGPGNQKVCLPNDAIFEINTLSLLNYDSLIQVDILSGLPTGAVANFSSNPITPSENSTLSIDMSNVTVGGNYPIMIQAYVPGEDTVMQEVYVEVVATDFSDLETLTPGDQATGVEEIPSFTWNPSAAAQKYNIEIASSPSFESSTIVDAATVTTNTYDIAVQLATSTVYYWRVQAINECLDGTWSPTKAFATKSFSCNTETSTHNPILISANGTPTIESTINITTDGIINDLNIVSILGNHNSIKELEVSLTGPDGTEVILFSELACASSTLVMGLDDEAPNSITQDCPPNGIGYQPINPLSAFDGKNSLGEWTLKVRVTDTFGDGGILNSWTIQLCAESNLNPPNLIKNETMPVAPASGRNITDEFLLVEDANNTPSELDYTLVTLPNNGSLYFLGNELSIGSTFRQSSVTGGNVLYVHDGSTTTEDHFTFTVNDGEGGLIATPQFNILIDPDVSVNTEDLEDENTISIFPNPANDILFIGFEKSIQENIQVQIFNAQGQLVRDRSFNNVDQLLQINTQQFANGVYFVQVSTKEKTMIERVTIQR